MVFGDGESNGVI